MSKKLSQNQSGIASIIITMFLMLIISLVVLGFARVTRREQRQSLDRQLNTQAYYAAESGVHDAQKYINDQLAAPLPLLVPFNTCTGPFTFVNAFNAAYPTVTNNIDSTTSYSCVLINPKPKLLSWSSVNPDGSITFPVKANGATLDSISISWNDPGNISPNYSDVTCASTTSPNQLPPLSGWSCGAGLLRVDIAPLNSLNRDDLIANTVSLVLYPGSVPGGGTVSYTTLSTPPQSRHGAMLGVDCSAGALPNDCTFTLNGLNTSFPLNTAGYYVRIRSIYRNAAISVSGDNGNAELVGAQAVVDSTGKAKDILKRLRVNLSLNSSATKDNSSFNYAIESADSICKVYEISPPATVNIQPGSDVSCDAP